MFKFFRYVFTGKGGWKETAMTRKKQVDDLREIVETNLETTDRAFELIGKKDAQIKRMQELLDVLLQAEQERVCPLTHAGTDHVEDKQKKAVTFSNEDGDYELFAMPPEVTSCLMCYFSTHGESVGACDVCTQADNAEEGIHHYFVKVDHGEQSTDIHTNSCFRRED